jgi:hypothetical protein
MQPAPKPKRVFKMKYRYFMAFRGTDDSIGNGEFVTDRKIEELSQVCDVEKYFAQLQKCEKVIITNFQLLRTEK